VQGDEHEPARRDTESSRGSGRAEAIFQRHQRVDHRVADQVDPLGRDALGVQVVDGLGAVHEEAVGEMVGDDAVQLLGHRAVEAAQAGLDVGEGDLHLRRGQRRGHGRVDVAGDDREVRALLLQDGLEPLHHPRRLLRVAAGADLEHVVRLGHAELLEEYLRHHPVVVLAGVDERVAALRQARAQGADHRRRLDEVGPGPDDVDDAHRRHSTRLPRRSASIAIRAQDEDSLRRQEALPQDRDGQAARPAGLLEPHPREEVAEAQAADGAAGRDRAG
jgi:hypothetical protein